MLKIQWTLLFIIAVACSENATQPPNVILIFADDLGYGDLSGYGSEKIKTPNIDNLAKGGVRFTSFYASASVCSPSRASLLTGSYANRVGIPRVLFPNGSWGSQPNIGLDPDEITIADMLQKEGYETAMAGKWHLGHLPMFLPTHQGFNQYLGVPYSNDMTISPDMTLAENINLREGVKPEEIATFYQQDYSLRRLKTPLMRNDEVVEFPADQTTLTSRYTDFSVEFINENANKNPFFLYLAHSMPHVPIYASDTFSGKSQGGLYGDVIEEIDWSLGQIVRALESNGILDNTLVIFTSDNGPWLSYGNHGGKAGALRGGKFDVWEGGFRVPAIMSMPGTIREGVVNDETVTTMDILPTIAALADAPLPANKIDGMNILPLLEGGAMPDLNERYFYYYKDTSLLAVRKGVWKYVVAHQGAEVIEPGLDGRDGITDYNVAIPEAIYHLGDDLGETTNLLGKYPEIALSFEQAGQAFDRSLKAEARPTGIDTTYQMKK